MTSVTTALERLAAQRDDLADLWTTRKMRLDLCLQLRVFERDALELSAQYEMWETQLQSQNGMANSRYVFKEIAISLVQFT